MENQNRYSLLLLAVLLRFLLLSTVADTITASHGEHPLPTSASVARRGLDMECTCTTCQNPCGDYPSPLPPIYDYPPPPVVYSSPPPPEAIYYYSPPPPSTPYCPPPPAPVQPVCCGGGGSTGGSSYSPYVSWFSPPGELYPRDPGYHPGAASRGHASWWLSLVVGGLVVLWR